MFAALHTKPESAAYWPAASRSSDRIFAPRPALRHRHFIADAIAGRDIQICGDGTPVRSYLHAADLAIWLWTMLFRADELNENPAAFNVGSVEAVSIRELAQIVAEELDPTLRVHVVGNSAIGAKRVQYIPSVHKAETELGLRPLINLREAIRRTATWHR